MGERLADRTNTGPDHRHPGDPALPGMEDLTPLDPAPAPPLAEHTYVAPPIDLDELRLITHLGGRPITRVPAHPEYL